MVGIDRRKLWNEMIEHKESLPATAFGSEKAKQAYIKSLYQARDTELARCEEYGEWRCPNCGWDSGNGDPDEPGRVTYGEAIRNNAAEIVGSAGWGALDWIETWTCPVCGTVFSFENSNY